MKDREVFITTEVQREKGWIYFVTTMDNGCLQIERARATGRPNLKRLKTKLKYQEQNETKK